MGIVNPIKFILGDIMKEFIKTIWFDCKLERFAEVFGDIIEPVDIEHLISVAPEETAKHYKALNPETQDPNKLFDLLDAVNSSELKELTQLIGVNPENLKIIRAFFRFVNDAYLWEDLEDLERWEEELSDIIGNEYTFLKGFKDEAYRSALFFKYLHYMGGVAPYCVETVADCLTSADRIGFYLGLF